MLQKLFLTFTVKYLVYTYAHITLDEQSPRTTVQCAPLEVRLPGCPRLLPSRHHRSYATGCFVVQLLKLL